MLSLQNESFEACNNRLQALTGIVDFFDAKEDFEAFFVCQNELTISNNERAEYGDFQTNLLLAQKICEVLRGANVQPKTIIEPTFGQGNFILAALQIFDEIEQIIGIEIYKPYIWQTKFSILSYYLQENSKNKPLIKLYHQSVFDIDFKQINTDNELLVLGNPPWVTNAMLSSLGSTNLPPKSNFKNHTGLEAITGKGNFDIGEYITLMLLKAFHQHRGNIAFLVKNTVIKNIIQAQKHHQFNLSNVQKQLIDAKKEFNVATDAALFLATFGVTPTDICTELNFYTQKEVKKIGWVNKKFVGDIQKYELNQHLDGSCPFEWRQGVKHDCSAIMELERVTANFKNGKGDIIDLESALVYPILKSSDLKNLTICQSRKYTIITQKKIGQDTLYIKNCYPNIWQYLMSNKSHFDKRKSSIYKGKPPFSIFGIGDYSFLPYKVAISGMYKTSFFSLVLPCDNKPIMLDDTCYFIGFDAVQDAMITQALLNSNKVQDFLQAIIFWDSKRAVTKDILCRIDITKIAKSTLFEDVYAANNQIKYECWEKYKQQFEALSQPPIF